ncbi:hypothetical protein CRUP_015886 [Coryphaenoides rupestris]|nr:hypothetical protein CRUP_015886 [Coryphaenoides rupestris]
MTHVNSLVMAVLVLATLCLSATQTSAASHACCREFSRGRIPLPLIRGYKVQSMEENCPIDAIIFLVKKGKQERKACVDPTLDWVKDTIRRFRVLPTHRHPPLPSSPSSHGKPLVQGGWDEEEGGGGGGEGADVTEEVDAIGQGFTTLELRRLGG